MAEHTEVLTCPRKHEVEVHYEEGQKADHWLCPECLQDPEVADEDARVKFGGKA